jgi:hypothetical protein
MSIYLGERDSGLKNTRTGRSSLGDERVWKESFNAEVDCGKSNNQDETGTLGPELTPIHIGLIHIQFEEMTIKRKVEEQKWWEHYYRIDPRSVPKTHCERYAQFCRWHKRYQEPLDAEKEMDDRCARHFQRRPPLKRRLKAMVDGDLYLLDNLRQEFGLSEKQEPEYVRIQEEMPGRTSQTCPARQETQQRKTKGWRRKRMKKRYIVVPRSLNG